MTGAEDAVRAAKEEIHKLKRGLMSASVWNVVANLGTQTATFVIFLILARLLSPSDFGMVAISMAFIDVTRGIMLGGIPEALIQGENWNDDDASAAFWLNMIAALAFTSVIFVIAICAHEFGGKGTTFTVLGALSCTLIIDGLRSVHEAHMRRHFRYKVLAIRSMTASIVAGIAGVVAAVMGAGVWALVVQRIATSLIQTIVIWTGTVFSPRLVSLRGPGVRRLLSFSAAVLVARSLTQLNRRFPDFVIGTFGGTHMLGLYRVGTRSLDYITNATVTPIQSASLSVFARLKDSENRARSYIRATELTAITTIPAVLGAGAIAPDFVHLAFGPRWAESAWPMMALSFTIIPITYVNFFQAAMQGAGRPSAASGPEVLRLVVGAVILSVAIPLGLLAASMGEVIRRAIVTPHVLHVLKRELGVTGRDAIHMVGIPAGWSVVMFGAIFICRETVLANMPIVARMALSVCLGVVVYGFGMLVVSRRFTRSVFASVASSLPPALKRIADAVLRFL